MRPAAFGRRRLLTGMGAGLALPLAGAGGALANQSRQIEWGDLIPEGVPYGEATGIGHYDEVNDIWIPEFDENASLTVDAFDGMTVRLPGYVVPLGYDENDMITEFLLAPFAGACIHVPPPPPNQIVYVTTDLGWPAHAIFAAVWVTGPFQSAASRTELAQVGYQMHAEDIEFYEW